MKRIERVRLYPTARQERALTFMLDVTRELYNSLLQERRDAYHLRRLWCRNGQTPGFPSASHFVEIAHPFDLAA